MTEAQAPAALACPKCGKPRLPEAQSCPRCGLVFALWREDNSVSVANLDNRGTELWQKIAGNWSDSGLHEEFLKHCLQTGTLAAAGRLYRERLDQDPKDTVAAHMQSQLLAKATLRLTVAKTQPREPVTRNRWFWVIVLSAMALGIAAGLFWRHLR
ncbi:MAG: zinc ribbon domain-containing protein [Deltaproteobacteria bacterium]|nr:zinc ribbon domain-containing protein [Deltaproteobacteria bacterium]